MARVKKSRESTPLGRVLAVLRAALDLTQSDLARLSGVKRSSISEYERGKSTPDAVTLERLLTAMRFRWTALDLGGWFVDRLLMDCRAPEGEDVRGGAAPLLVTASALATRLSADVVAANQTAARLSRLVLTLQEETKKEDRAPARDRKAERRAAQALWVRIKPFPRKEQVEALRSAPPEEQWAVCDLLCTESQRFCGEDPVKAASLSSSLLPPPILPRRTRVYAPSCEALPGLILGTPCEPRTIWRERSAPSPLPTNFGRLGKTRRMASSKRDSFSLSRLPYGEHSDGLKRRRIFLNVRRCLRSALRSASR
jgi:transcriptional regulator with XRE-family HTH domain